MVKYLIIIITLIFTLIIGSFFIRSSPQEKLIDIENLEKITLRVSIPCPGHALLIEKYLNNLNGIEKIEYNPITTFVVYYDKNKTSEEDILDLDIFKNYPAVRIN